VLLEAPAKSLLSHVRIANTAATIRGAWQLTAGATFYASDVELRDTHFDGSMAEDALNIVRSDFSMTRVEIARTASDAFDSDFSTGSIRASSIHDVQGDAIDSSGSQISIDQVQIADVRDKAISAGEDSEVVVRKAQVSGVGAGVVSKDLSRVDVDGIELLGVRHAAFMSYTKKPEYGVGTLVAKNAVVEQGTRLGLAQRGSSLIVNGTRIEDTELNVDALYEEGFMRK
jgi:hypothetical protein